MEHIETYTTSRVKNNISLRMINFLLGQVDKYPKDELDYLQIFTIQILSNSVVIEHSQEVPPRKTYYYMTEEIIPEETIKLYLIYENNYRVLMYSNEY
ncbi:MAG: DUF960 family protein [Sarcina sp.]